MRSAAFKFGLTFSILVVLMIAAFEGGRLRQEFGLSEKDPVLVFVIPNLDNARRVRAAIVPERIAWKGEEGLALVGGQVVALSLEDAGEVIEGAGWVDRPIQIVRLENPGPEAADEAEAGSHEARLARLQALVHKPTLTRGEQMFVLSAMNDGLEI